MTSVAVQDCRASLRASSLSCAVLLSALLVSCAPTTTTQSPLPSEPRRIVRAAGDTAYYTVEFVDAKERRKFVSGIDNLVDRYAKRMETDTVGSYIRIRVLPAKSEAAPVDSLRPSAAAEAFPAAAPAAAQPVDTGPPPLQGGSLAFYSHRAYLDESLLRLVQTDPFAGDTAVKEGDSSGRCPPLLRALPASGKRARFSLPDRIVNGAGQRISALDIVDAWNALAHAAPAQARGVFRNVAGIDGMLRGTEAMLRGIQATDERTIAVSFAAEDPGDEARMHAPALLPASLKLGRYFVKDTRGPVMTLTANQSYPCGKAFLEKITLTLGGEGNPLLSFSLGKYDLITLYAARDVEYARTRLADKAALEALSRDHYFLSVANPSDELRGILRGSVRPADMLARSVKASGPLLSTLTDTVAAAPGQPGGSFLKQAPSQSKALVVAFMKDDPASVSIADYLLAELSRTGISCQIKACDGAAYEQALASRAFDIAVGWLPAVSLAEPGGNLRIAARWFGDAGDEQSRLRENREIPLFAVTTFALCKKGISFHRGDLTGICRIALPL